MHFENEIEHKILVTYVIAKVSGCKNAVRTETWFRRHFIVD
ncbi:Leucine-responsive regulatory protein, regulator for leucine (or lrp) regulon and high-affinity branched-chain amino acid transport system [Neisseria meningitidis serogroup B]|uniref:Leucine-responsive regulatory protein, regulator for leucine (Or lrp) regulon and high-affinity branched-chain amino acid transport system n=1 Tax=Neisseria meningitidis serogroup B TaxID=491 RepID=A0A0H5QD60_NEIMI|nr:Leucine-responsive regulatory protein, regulator for leucine (or lrp) regulon and high-affinity branched-chain amino acid transport system [Neisseria meningitidis serogroup B]